MKLPISVFPKKAEDKYMIAITYRSTYIWKTNPSKGNCKEKCFY